MKLVYILEYRTLDKLSRAKNPRHVGVFSNIETLERAKQKILDTTPNAVFEVYNCEHIFFKS